MPATVPWTLLIQKLETLWVLYEFNGGMPAPPEGVVPSLTLDAECDALLEGIGTGKPRMPDRPEIAQWLRLRAVAAWSLVMAYQKAGKRPHRGDWQKVLHRYLVREWHTGLREWWILRKI